MHAQEALASLDAEAWASTNAVERLALIETIQSNLLKHADEMGSEDARMKNSLTGEGAVSQAEGIGTASRKLAMSFSRSTSSPFIGRTSSSQAKRAATCTSQANRGRSAHSTNRLA